MGEGCCGTRLVRAERARRSRRPRPGQPGGATHVGAERSDGAAAFSARSEPSGYWCGSLADAPRGGAFKEGALRGPASVQPRSLNANTQRQGGRCFGFKRYVFGSAPLFAQQTNTAAIVYTTNKHRNHCLHNNDLSNTG